MQYNFSLKICMQNSNQFSHQKIVLPFSTEENQYIKRHIKHVLLQYCVELYPVHRYTPISLVKNLNKTILPEDMLAKCIKKLKNIHIFDSAIPRSGNLF